MSNDVELATIAMTAEELNRRLMAALDDIVAAAGHDPRTFDFGPPRRDSKLLSDGPAHGKLFQVTESVSLSDGTEALGVTRLSNYYESQPPLFTEVVLSMMGRSLIRFSLSGVEKAGEPITRVTFHAGIISDDRADGLRQLFAALLTT